MNKTELIDTLATRLAGDKKTAAAAVEGLIDVVSRAVSKGEKVAITGFGVFEKRNRSARTARNPRTGATIKVKKTSVPAFRPGQQFKDVVSGTKKLGKVATTPVAKTAATARGAATATTRATSSTAKSTPAPTTAKATAKSAPAKKAAKASTGKSAGTKKTTAAKSKTAKSTPAKKSATKSTSAKVTAAAKTLATAPAAKAARKTAAKKASS